MYCVKGEPHSSLLIESTDSIIEDMHTKKVNECAVTSERIVFLVKTTNSNVTPTLSGFRWYPYFESQE